MRKIPEKAMILLKKLEEAGERGLTVQEMGELFYGSEDILYNRYLIEWNWEKRKIEEGEHKGKEVWVKVCRLSELGKGILLKSS